MSFDNAHKLIHNIDSDGCGPPENCEKNFGPSQLENRNMAFDTRKDYHHPRGGYASWGQGRVRSQDRPLYYMYPYHKSKTNHCSPPLWLKKLTIHLIGISHYNQHPHTTLHTNTPTLAQSTSQITIDTLCHITNHTSTPLPQAKVIPPTQPAITYPPQLLYITYPTTNTQTIQPKMEPNTLPPPPAQHLEPSQQSNNFPTIRTINTITEGSNLDFQKSGRNQNTTTKLTMWWSKAQ
jgi:hypothetical protein